MDAARRLHASSRTDLIAVRHDPGHTYAGGSPYVLTRRHQFVVSADDGTTMGREYYQLSGQDGFAYRIDLSSDGGKTWDAGVYEIAMTRVE